MLAGRIGGLRCGVRFLIWQRRKGRRDGGLTLSLRVPRASPISSSVFHAVSALSAPTGHLPHLGRGTASAEDRVLSCIAYLRRSPSLSFIPLEPYPARFARHLPHAGKALAVVILFFSTYACIRSDNARKAVSSYRSLPHWGRGTASAVDRVLSYIAYLRRSPSLSFIPPVPYPPLWGTFPTRGRLCVGDTLF